MKLLTWLHNLLGINYIAQLVFNNYSILNRHAEIVDNRLCSIETAQRAIEIGLGHIIAKLDPALAINDDDPKKIAESKEISDTIIRRLKAEQSARDHTVGRSNG